MSGWPPLHHASARAPAAPSPPAAGDEVAGVYACTRKDRLLARTGTPYLALELRDRTGALPARAFRDADILAGRFERGDLVRVRGRVERFRDELQVDVRAIERAEARRPGRVPAGRLPRHRRARRLPRAPRARGPRPRLPRPARALLGDAALRAAWRARAVHARRPPRLPRRAARAHRRGRRRSRSRPAALHPRLNSDLLLMRRARPRPRQDARVHLRRRDRPQRGGPAARPRRARPAPARRARRAAWTSGRRLALAHCVLCHHGPDAAPGPALRLAPRRSRSTGSTRSTRASRARWSTGSTSPTKVRRGVHHSVPASAAPAERRRGPRRVVQDRPPELRRCWRGACSSWLCP